MAEKHPGFMIYFIIPTYNESDNIEQLAKNLRGNLTNYQKFYVFVDDASTDDTLAQINNFFHGLEFHIIDKKINVGPGDSFKKGFEWIIAHSKNSDDKIVTIEADNTSDVGILENMIVISNLGYSLVLASIYIQSGGFVKTSFFRKIISFFANMLFRVIFEMKVSTLSSFYRVYHLSLIVRIKQQNENIISESGFISMLEILIKAIKADASIIEVPMQLNSENRKGKSKMKIYKTSMEYLKFLIREKFVK